MQFTGYHELLVLVNSMFTENELQHMLCLLEKAFKSGNSKSAAQKICSYVSNLHNSVRWIVACGINVYANEVHPKHLDVSLLGILKPESFRIFIIRGARCDGSAAPIYGSLEMVVQSGRTDSSSMLPERFTAVIRSLMLSTQKTSAAVASDIHDFIRRALPQRKFVVVAGRTFTCEAHKDSVVFWAKSADIWIIIIKLAASSE